MKLVGITELPLHWGKAPRWLFNRMAKLAKCVTEVIIYEYGKEELLRRLSNPFWFQAYSCVLGWDYHSSGSTTVTLGALKTVLSPEEHGIGIAGGKGKTSRKTPEEIKKIGDVFNLSTRSIEKLVHSSRMVAKVDNTLIQSGHPLYHHSFIVAENKKWSVLQQGFNIKDQTARRYHWLSDNVKSFVEEPHSAICCDVKKENVLDMTSKKSKEARKISVDLVKEGPRRVKSDLLSIRPIFQKSLSEFLPVKKKEFVAHVLTLPKNVNWKALEKAYDFQPKNYEELIGIEGIGPATVRGLALVSEVIYGSPPSWKDPVKFSFAYGGKDGVPRPVDKKAMDESIKFLDEVIKQVELGKKERIEALKRLKSIVPT
jgi:hypothetical protein